MRIAEEIKGPVELSLGRGRIASLANVKLISSNRLNRIIRTILISCIDHCSKSAVNTPMDPDIQAVSKYHSVFKILPLSMPSVMSSHL